MVSEKLYDLCLPILSDAALGEEEKTDKLEEILSSEPTSLKGKALEDAVLGALWQWKSTNEKLTSPPPARGAAGAANRAMSPAPWLHRSGTPSASAASSPRMPSAIPVRGPLARTASAASSFTSPKPSPRLAFAMPAMGSHSGTHHPTSPPALSAMDSFGDYGSDTVDWLTNDDDMSSTVTLGDVDFAPGADFLSASTADMTPYDMLRSILQNHSTDAELEQILEANGYDLGQTVTSIMTTPGLIPTTTSVQETPRTYLVGKSMAPAARPTTPAGQQKSPVVCRYWLASGHCARADCRFAHEVQNSHVCKYWLQGNCFAGANCLFSHDPSTLMAQISISNDGANSAQQFVPNFQLQDYDSFPALQPTSSNPYDDGSDMNAETGFQQNSSGLFPTQIPTGPRQSQPNSRPGSRHSSRAPTPSQPNFQDDEAFPTLGSAAAFKPQSKRHHGKRGGHGNQGASSVVAHQPTNLADVVRMNPPTQPLASMNSRDALRRGLRNNRSFTSSRENSTLAMQIPPPCEIPWLETGEKANQAYLKARQEAFKHGGQRNKFLQSAAQAWNRNDARGAKALSLRGQNENALMREAHREAARALYDARNKNQGVGKEIYIDLHGLHPEEAVDYLSDCLMEQKSSSRPIYAICGTGHHSKNGKDKVGKAVRLFLNEWRYAFREFSVPGDRNNIGGILGVDPTSYDKSMSAPSASEGGESAVA
ncbi:hypothetical protein BDY17DRAFT_252242 [Neohortaea acidophila]|uniref:CCCH zinc finger and SMR domain-containing protein n=1 Tax=Neohortaea acidophila TaxID=245834 RepID=A0A6A6PRF8_9PEZI|nr:uncharacterized protein BDY17DRAFT_252242 [Neohortaea acidophila]KAF2482234.1 hypothetical protein BDY17DRAFT_252242 [Neohortaea acidophila]